MKKFNLVTLFFMLLPMSLFAQVAKVGETPYATFSEALSAWGNNTTLTLLANVETSTTITINNKTCTLDLNGFGIKRTGSGRVIEVNGTSNFTINDSNPNAEHRFTVTNAYGDAGLGVVNDALTEGYLTFYGGYVTGGCNANGAGIYAQSNSSVITINGGVFIGNGSGTTHGGFYWGHTGPTLIMNGGRIIYNMCTAQGAGVFFGNTSTTFKLYGGEISHNRSTGGSASHAGGVCASDYGTLYLHGSPLVTGNIGGKKIGSTSYTNQPNDIFLHIGSNDYLNIDGEMTNTTPIGIIMVPSGYNGTVHKRISTANTTYISNETTSYFTPQNDSEDEIVCIDNTLYIWNSTQSTESFAYLTDTRDRTALLTSMKTAAVAYDDVYIGRTIVAGPYNTLCLPFSMTASQIASSPLAGATLKEYNGADVTGEGADRNLNIHLTDLEQIQAGKPFLIKTDVDIVNPHFTGVTVDATAGELVERDHVDFQGILAPYDLAAAHSSSPDYLGIGMDGRLYWASASKSTGPMRAFRAFFHVKDAGASYSPVHRGMPAQFVEDAPKAPTDIDQVTNDQSPMTNARKIVHDGVLYIIRGDKVYTARGQEVK